MKSGAHFVLLLGGRKRTEVLLLTGRRFCDCVSDFSGGFSFKFMPRGGGTCNNSKKAAIRTRSGEWTIFKMAASSPSLKGGYVTWNDIRAIILAHYVYVDCMSLQRGHFGRWTDLPGRDTMLLYNYRVPYFRCLFLSKSGTAFFGVYYISKYRWYAALQFSRHAEIRLLSGPGPSYITYFGGSPYPRSQNRFLSSFRRLETGIFENSSVNVTCTKYDSGFSVHTDFEDIFSSAIFRCL